MINISQRTKFNVSPDTSKRTYDDIVFDSNLEMRYYRDVVLPKLASGEFVSCEMQVPFILQEKFIHDGKTVQPIIYVADFVITDNTGQMMVIDTKGKPDTTATIKRKLFWHVYPYINYQWISFCQMDGGWIPYDDLKRNRRQRKKIKNKKD